jgi:iron complex outermembrane receptor protein
MAILDSRFSRNVRRGVRPSVGIQPNGKANSPARRSCRSAAHRRLLSVGLLLCFVEVSPAIAQSRTSDNAVTQAEDAFGFSVGRETVGIYSADVTRGFSPLTAGNVRLDGLYFDRILSLTNRISDSSSIKVGLAAQGYPFAAPSGIVDYRLNRPKGQTAASIIANTDDYGTAGIEADGSVAISPTLSLGYGLSAARNEFFEGTHNWTHNESIIANWQPLKNIEVTPFWMLVDDYDDQVAPIYVPAGSFLPLRPQLRHFVGPDWAALRTTGANSGLIASASLDSDWIVRLGAFRSVMDFKSTFSNLLSDEQPDGIGDRRIIADPRHLNRSLSGEVRVTHTISDGPRLHVFHLSVRRRDAHSEFGGSDVIDYGLGRVDDVLEPPKPDFSFGPLSKDHVQQTTIGLAYDGRWKNVGELGISLSRADYMKETALPGEAPVVSRARPWLYDVTVGASLAKGLIAYAGYTRGLEESGLAPSNASNRNEPLLAILTEQKDAGLRLNVTSNLRAVAGLFDLSRPYFGFDSNNRFVQVGTMRSKGAEFSISGGITPRLSMLIGGVFFDSSVQAAEGTPGTLAKRPAGFTPHVVNASLNWRTPFKGLEFDVALYQRAKFQTTTDGLVRSPALTKIDLGAHYRFKLARRPATLRILLHNIFNDWTVEYFGPGVYGSNTPRTLSASLATDI